MHIKSVVQEMQAVAKNSPLKQHQITRSLLGGMQLLKQLQTSSQSVTMLQKSYREGSDKRKLKIERTLVYILMLPPIISMKPKKEPRLITRG